MRAGLCSPSLKMGEEYLISPEPHADLSEIDQVVIEKVEALERGASYYEERPAFILFRLHARAFGSKGEFKLYGKRLKALALVNHRQISGLFLAEGSLGFSEVSLGSFAAALLRRMEGYWRSSFSIEEEVVTPQRGSRQPALLEMAPISL